MPHHGDLIVGQEVGENILLVFSLLSCSKYFLPIAARDEAIFSRMRSRHLPLSPSFSLLTAFPLVVIPFIGEQFGWRDLGISSVPKISLKSN